MDYKVRACKVYLNGQHIGATKDGVTFTVKRDFVDITVDEFGTSLMDKILTGNNLEVKFKLGETTIAKLEKVLPEGDYVNPGSDDGKIGLGRRPGYKLSQDAVELRLHPLDVLDDTDHTKDIYIWKAVSAESVEIPYVVDGHQLVEVTFVALVDEDRADGQLLGRVGDETVS